MIYARWALTTKAGKINSCSASHRKHTGPTESFRDYRPYVWGEGTFSPIRNVSHVVQFIVFIFVFHSTQWIKNSTCPIKIHIPYGEMYQCVYIHALYKCYLFLELFTDWESVKRVDLYLICVFSNYQHCRSIIKLFDACGLEFCVEIQGHM